jgi:carboxyl-terminal processing protease
VEKQFLHDNGCLKDLLSKEKYMYGKQLYQLPQIAVVLGVLLNPTLTYALSAEEEEQGIPMEDVQRFSNAIAQIKQYYVKPVRDQELFDNAIRGMLEGLDPHSGYLNEEEFNELQTSTSGEFGGLGIEVTMEDGIVKVIAPLDESPAAKAHVMPGDYIIKVNARSVQGIHLKEAIALMRGKVGEPITLTVLRKGEKKPIIFKMVRENIQIKSVQQKLLDNQYGYVRLAQFQAMSAQDMLKSIADLKKQAGGSLKGLVLDLRNNPGGLLDSAIQIADAFIDTNKLNKEPELIVYTEGRLAGSKFTAVATPGDVLNHAPMVVLINSGSASASEIVAGALKDNKRAIILGTRSFGKGTVQTILPLDTKHGIKLTTALYFTPSGTSIQAEGITPDISVDEISVPHTILAKNNALDFSEADLSGHLLNANKSKEVLHKSSNADEQHLLHEDYQLYAALTILKSLAVAKQ